MKKKVLIIAHTNTFFVELFRLARMLKNSKTFHPVIHFPNRYPTVDDDTYKCLQEEIDTINENGQIINPAIFSKIYTQVANSQISNDNKSILRKIIPSSLRGKIRKFVTTDIYKFTPIRYFQLKKNFSNRAIFLLNLIEHQNPAVIVIGGDMVGYDTSVLIKCAHQKQVRVLIVPSTMSNGLEQAEAYFHDPDHNLYRWVNRWAARKYPKWVFTHRGRKLLRVEGERVLLMEKLGLAPPLPWIFNSGQADAIAIESPRMEAYYLECGLPENQLKVIGSLADDVMVEIFKQRQYKRSELCEELDLPKNKPILLTALPPDFLYMPGGRPECDFKIYSDLVRFWVQSVAGIKNHNVIVCLHPSDKYENFSYIEEWGVRIARRNTAELVPLCDIYVASVSSTIRWAIACGFPVVNYDVYRYRYIDYLGLEGVLTMEEQSEFAASLNKLSSDTNYYTSKKLAQVNVSKNWGMFDGEVSKRMLSLLDELSIKLA